MNTEKITINKLLEVIKSTNNIQITVIVITENNEGETTNEYF